MTIKTIGIGSVGVVAAVIGFTLSDTEVTGYKQTLLNGSCQVAKGCLYTYPQDGYCVCLTNQDTTNPLEVKSMSIPTARSYRFVSCQSKNGPYVGYIPSIAPDPVGYKCVVVLDKTSRQHTLGQVGSDLVAELQEKCCVGCDKGKCFVSADSWGACPYCLNDNNCEEYCHGTE